MSVSNKRSVAGARASARSLKTDVGTGRVRIGLLGSTALIAVSLAASGAMAQTTVVNPTGGGTITRVGGSNPTVTNQTATGGGLQITNVTQSTGLTVNGVTINQTVTGPTTNALDIRGSTSGLNSTGVAFDGVNTLTTTVSGGAAYFQQTNANEGVSFLSSGSTLTGSYGVWLNAPGGYLDFNSAGQGQSFIANGTAIAGLNAISAINNNLQLGTSTFTGFATGVNATNLYGSSLTSTGGSINATSTGIRLDATGGASTVNSQTAITAPIGINSTNTNGATITTSGGGTIDASVAGVGTGIIASSSGGTTLDPFTINVGAAIGDITAFATGVTASTTGSSTNIINISTTAAITATSRGISVTAGTFGNTGTFNLGADVTGATGVYTNVGNYAVNVASGVTVTSTGNGATNAALYLINGTNTVTNDGALTASGTGSHGVHFSSDGLVTNTATGTITGSTGIWYQNLASVNNAGTITGTGSTGTAGVYGSSGASVTNTGTITGFDGVYSGGNPTTHNNTGGTITGVSHGYNVTGGRLTLTNTGVINTAGGTGGAGLSGLRLATSLVSLNTVTNSGTITGGGDATHGFGVEVEDGALTLNNQSGGVITGGIGAIRLASDDLATLNLNAGSTVTGDIVSSNTGARTVTLAGTLAGDYANAAASGVVTFTLASTGSMQAATFGSANDTFTWQGGTIGGVINAGGGTGDIFNSALGAGNAGSLSLGNLTGFETYNHQSGTLTLTGSRLTGPGWAVTSGASITLDGALTTTTGTGTALTINGNTSGSDVQILSGATIGGFSGLFFNGGPAATFNNAGTISVSSRGLNTNGQTAMTNSGTIASSGEIGISTGFSVASLTNSGTVSGGSTSTGISSQYSAMSITNQAGGFITGGSTGILGGTAGFGGLLTMNNASGAGITGATAIVTAGNAGISLTNTGQIVGSTHAINAGGSGAVTITNNAGGVIATGTLASAGATYVAGGTGSAITTSGSATIVNNGTIYGNSFGAFSNGGLLTVTNGGSISVGNGGDAVVAVGTANVLNSGTITADLYSAVNVLGGGTVVNAAGGTLTGGTEATFGEAVQFLSGTASFTNYGSASSAIGRGVFVAGSATTTINLHAGSMTGSILTGSGNDTLSIFSGRGTAGAASVDAPSGITLQNAGTLAAASFGTIDLGAGTNTLNLRGTGDGSAANGTGGSFGLGGAVGVSTLAKLDTGTWTLTGNGSGITTINAGTGTPGGLLIFNGSNLTAGIYVNGATVRANSTTAFGTGILHMIDPTAEFAATGTYANAISLEVVNGQQAADPTILRNASGGTITLSGRIYETNGVGGANQYVTFDGAGTTILSNATNSWGGVTTINSGTTLQGGTGTISGGSIANAGALVFSQTIDGTFSQAISGTGTLQVNAPSQAVTLGGVNTYSGTTTVSAGTLIASGGGAIGDTSAVSVAGGATLNLAAAETIGSLSGSGTVQVGADTLTVGGDNSSTEFSGSITDAGALAFVGSWRVSDGVAYSTAPPIYSGIEAAALLFGGDITDYRISTASDQVANITDTAWYSGYGIGWAEYADDRDIDLGAAGYSQPGDYSTYVQDFGDPTKINYAFAADMNAHGGGGLTHVGTGTLILSGTNTYTGTTLIQAGTLELRNGAAIADTGLVSIAAGGTLAVNTSETIGNLTGSGATTLVGILTLAAGSGTYDGDVSGTGTLTLAGGNLTLGGTLTNAGGLTLGSGTTATISATGAVTPAGTVAVIMSDGSSLTNRGSVSGSSLGVLGLSGTFNVVNSGTIAGANAAGVQAQGNLTLTNQTGGSISGRTGIYASGVATVTNAAGATISAGSLSNTVRLAGTGSSLTNAGDITGTTTYAGVFFDRTGTVTNQAGGLISNTGTAVQFTGAGSVLDNAGTISNTNTTSAVYFGSSGSVTNRAAGVITSNNWAVELVGDTASVTNAGSITGQRGVHLWGADSVVDNSGTITGSRTAVGTTGTSTITNALGGTLAGTTYNGVFGSGAGTSVDNAGLITGGNAAIYLEGADNTVTNTGTIQVTGTTAPTVISGVYMSGAGASLTNSGTIESTLTDGRGVYLAGSTGAITNQSGGVISGNGTGAAIILTGVDYTVDLQSGSTVNGLIDASVSTGHNALTVAGTLNGGYAGGTGADDITLIAGMTVTGLMDGGAGTDSLVLDGAADSALNMGLTTGFESRTLDGTGVWTLSGIDGDAAGWTLNAGTLRVTGSQSVNNGAGVQVNSGATLSIVDSEAIGALAGAGSVSIDAGQMLFVGVDGSSGTFDGVIAGAGGLSQYGAGILTLSGANTYTGDTRVDFGTLRLGASGVIADASILFVASGATLDLRGHDETVAIAVLNGTVNGTGVPAAPLFTAGKGGDGRSTLPAEAVALAAVGTGTLTAAEYQLNGATINANLGTGNLFNTGGVSTLNGTASAGLVSVQAGTLWLGADERLADTATVSVSSGATLDLNDQTETIGSLYGMGDVAIGAGQLTFGGTESAFGGILTGSGSLVHTGGLFTLAGNHTLASLNSTGGELRFLGTTTGGVSVTGGSLTGAGTIGGALTMAAGSILSPGLAGQVGSIGTFTAGSLDLNGATLALGVLGTVGGNLSDRLVITGTADLTGGVIVPTFMAQPGGYDFVTRYQFLTAGNLVGTFSNGSEFAAASGQTGMYWRVVYDLTPNAAVLELRKLTDFTLGAGGSANQNAVGQALSGGQLDAGADWSAVLELLAGLNGTQQQAAFDSMGGEALADMSSSLLVANDAFAGAVRQAGASRTPGATPLNFASAFSFVGGRDGAAAMITGVLDAFDPSAGTGSADGGWISVHASDVDLDGKAGQADLQTRLNAFVGGYAVGAGDYVLGAAAGATRVESKVEARQSSFESDLLHAAVYARFDDGRWAADLTASAYGGELDSRRTITVGAFTGQARGQTHGEGQSLSASVARRFVHEDGSAISVGLMQTLSRSTVDAFTETGAGGLSLESADKTRNWQTTQVNLRGTQDYQLSGQPLRLYGGLGLLVTTGDREAGADLRFSGAATGFGGYTIEGAQAAPLAATTEFGFEYQPREGLTLSTGYRGVFSERLRDDQIGARMSIAW